MLTFDDQGEALSQGSGFFVSADGALVTNYHVIDGASSVIAKMDDGRIYAVEGLLAQDSVRDLAVLKVTGKELPFLPLGSITSAAVGQNVIAIGSPLGLEATASTGIVSGIRTLEDDFRIIQTSAPISPGSSGGVLLNSNGEVLGVTAFRMVAGENLNFAVPADYIRQLLGPRRVIIPFLGSGNKKPEALETKDQSEKAASSPLVLPPEWIFTNDASKIVTVRVEGDYIYEVQSASEKLGMGRVDLEGTCETKSTGSEWLGKCTAHIAFYDYLGAKVKQCVLELVEVLKTVTPRRIEGESQNFSDRPDADGCLYPTNGRTPFAMIPRY